MAKGVKLSDNIIDGVRQFQFCKHFLDAAPEGFAVDGTVAALNARGGGVSCTTAATDNDPAGLKTDGELAVVAEDKPLMFRARVQFSEANTDDANVFVGMADQALTAILQDDGAGPPADYSGLGFYKTDGGSANWSIEAANSTTHVTKELDSVNSFDGNAHPAAGSSYQELEINVVPKTSAVADVVFKIDGITVYKITDWTFTSLGEMALTAAIKAGSANAEALNVTYFHFAQVL